MTLLSLASKQNWPQVLATIHCRPERLLLLHSDDLIESRGPAERLRDFFLLGGPSVPHHVELHRIPHNDFSAAIAAIADAAEARELDSSNCLMNLTGGNKLMAMAAAEWSRLNGVQCFYLERQREVFTFTPTKGRLEPGPVERLDPHAARDVEPLALLRCQIGPAQVTGSSQRLTLNERGRNLPEHEIRTQIVRSADFRKFLVRDPEVTNDPPGAGLEYAAAFALLKLGVPVVQRGVHLAPKTLKGPGGEEGELDLVFNWAGKLWVVDCKDRNPAESKVEKVRTEILKQFNPDHRLSRLLDDLEDEFRERDLHPLKEDLLTVAEAAGLLGRAICVRLAPLPPQAREFAESRRLDVALKDNLVADLRRILETGP